MSANDTKKAAILDRLSTLRVKAARVLQKIKAAEQDLEKLNAAEGE